MVGYARPNGIIAHTAEIDFASGGTGTAVYTLISASLNHNGMVFYDCFIRITEQPAGSSEDQGVITIKDTAGSPATIGTITTTDTTGPAAEDIIRCTNTAQAAADDAAMKFIAAGLGLTVAVTQETAGTPAGKGIVICICIPLDDDALALVS